MLNLLQEDLWTIVATKQEIKGAIGDLAEVSEQAIETAVNTKAGEIMDYIDTQLSNVTSFEPEIQQTVPDPSEAEEGKIYFVPVDPDDPDNHDHYEYIKVGDKMELIGGTAINSDDYVAKDNIGDLIDNDTLTLDADGKITVVHAGSDALDDLFP